MNQELKPCPFCGDPMRERGGLIQHVEQTEGCPIRQEAWDSGQIDRWNRRTDALEGGVTVKHCAPDENDAERVSKLLGTGVDGQVVVSALEDGEYGENPCWLWRNHETNVVGFGRWSKVAGQAPYIRADLAVKAVLSALSAPAQRVEEGWKLVPVEPTVDMLVSSGTVDGWNEAASRGADACHTDWWHRMLAASPAPAPHAGVDAPTDEQLLKLAKETFSAIPSWPDAYPNLFVKFARAALEDRT